MPRVLGGEKKMVIQDNLSACEIHLNYRIPTPKEIVSYRNGGTKRVRNKMVNRMGENRLEHGIKILTGFRDGDFQKVVDGNAVDFSSDQKSKNYDPEWKKLVEDQASDLIETLAFQVFDGSSQVITPDNSLDEDDESGEDTEGN